MVITTTTRIGACGGLAKTVNRLATANGMQWYEKFGFILRRYTVMMWLIER